MTSHKNVKNKRDSLLISTPQNGKTGLFFFFVSLVLHGLFFVSLIFVHNFNLPKPMPQIIQIDLVSFSPQPVLDEPAPSTPADTEVKDEGIAQESNIVKKKKTKTKHIKPDISLKTKPKNLKKLMAIKKKKKEPVKKKKKPPVKKIKEKKVVAEKTADVVKEKAEPQVEDEDKKRIADALSRLQQKVKEQGKGKEDSKENAYKGQGKKGYKPIDLYHLIIESAIKQSWTFNETLAGMDKSLEVVILIKILQSGEIRDIIYETKSGNRYLDESAKKALKKANPLPPLPAGRRSYDLGLIFTPRGLK